MADNGQAEKPATAEPKKDLDLLEEDDEFEEFEAEGTLPLNEEGYLSINFAFSYFFHDFSC